MRQGDVGFGGHGRANTRRCALLIALLTGLVAALSPAVANATSTIAVSTAIPTNVSVGDTNVQGSLTITNNNSGGDTSTTLCEPGDPSPCPVGSPGTTLIPSCSSMDFMTNCIGANTGVFSIHPTATGGAATACNTKTFTVTVVDGTYGKVRFAPSGGNIILPTTGSSCRIDFTFDVLAQPVDANGATGYQTLQRAEALGVSNLGTPSYSPATQQPVTVTLASPTLSDIDPDSPANDNAPEIKGTAPAGTTTVRLYTTADCSGSIVAQGSAATFASPGLTGPVNDNSMTTFYATAVDNLGGVSNCSSSSVTYTEDSIAPDTPTLSATSPVSPADNNSPRIKGLAEAGSTVRLYTDSSCTGTVAATGSAAALAAPGLLAAVANDTSTTFYATATDAASLVSPCSDGINYVEDSTTPVPPTLSSTNPTSPGNDTSPRIVGSAEAGSTVTVYTNASCTGSPVVTGNAGALTTPGLQVTVADNSSTTFYAKAADAAGHISACSTGITFVEDSLPPASATIAGTTPQSPSKENSLKVTGTSSAGTTVQLYADAACTVPILTRKTAAQLAAGIEVTVADNSTTTFYIRAFDAADNASACSTMPVTYIEDSDVPETTISGGPTGEGVSSTPTFTFSSSDPGATFECRIDAGEFTPCTSPYTTPVLGAGAHSFEVRSRDAAGNIDASSEVRSFTVGSGFAPPPPPPPVAPPPPPPATPPTKRAQPGCVGISGAIYLGTNSANTRTGVKTTDIMFGLGGNDKLNGLGGVDCLYGEEGNDRLTGGAGADRLFGGLGSDRLNGNAANDQLSGSFGNDRIDGGTGNDRLTGAAGKDTITDRGGTDRFSGGSGADKIDARDTKPADRRKRDRILCGAGKDKVLADPRDIVAKDCEKKLLVRRSLRSFVAR